MNTQGILECCTWAELMSSLFVRRLETLSTEPTNCYQHVSARLKAVKYPRKNGQKVGLREGPHLKN